MAPPTSQRISTGGHVRSFPKSTQRGRPRWVGVFTRDPNPHEGSVMTIRLGFFTALSLIALCGSTSSSMAQESPRGATPDGRPAPVGMDLENIPPGEREAIDRVMASQ